MGSKALIFEDAQEQAGSLGRDICKDDFPKGQKPSGSGGMKHQPLLRSCKA